MFDWQMILFIVDEPLAHGFLKDAREWGGGGKSCVHGFSVFEAISSFPFSLSPDEQIGRSVWELGPLNFVLY